MENDRKIAARLAKELYEGKITFSEFLTAVPDDATDDDIAELIDLITHEPKRGGFMGVSTAEHERYLAKINLLIEKLSL
jgi:hypothetical protein